MGYGVVLMMIYCRDIISKQVWIFCNRLWRVALSGLSVQHLSDRAQNHRTSADLHLYVTCVLRAYEASLALQGDKADGGARCHQCSLAKGHSAVWLPYRWRISHLLRFDPVCSCRSDTPCFRILYTPCTICIGCSWWSGLLQVQRWN